MKLEHLQTLTKDIRITAAEIDAQPDDREWAMAETDALEALRMEALQLARNIEAVLGELNGSPPPADAGSWGEYKHRTRK